MFRFLRNPKKTSLELDLKVCSTVHIRWGPSSQMDVDSFLWDKVHRVLQVLCHFFLSELQNADYRLQRILALQPNACEDATRWSSVGAYKVCLGCNWPWNFQDLHSLKIGAPSALCTHAMCSCSCFPQLLL